ncbi:hypothetical protein A6B43_01955 [Vespertiliibacter pulmonis]|uniref:Uncharacterized protein n=1 Tax=Vespertiliibacter pulmonis TaxID=1443036 RepID=A0A3N4W5E8_9PAST|nr:hypothetical protein [Vespertiliibacter pulmonis]QLB20394.1 hypothetical protein A6B43_01955 [Vespertiliibacter pulmonis]RPE86381.1 hypothetical protein EDC46_0779 [Vespertiliibacter pulmonis]
MSAEFFSFFDIKNISFLFSIISIVFGIKKYYIDTFNKKEIQDFEQISKYFLSDKIDSFKKEHIIIQQMLCNTVSIFKGITFEHIYNTLQNNNIDLNAFKKLHILIKAKYINSNYQKQKGQKNLKVKPSWFTMIMMAIFLIISSLSLATFEYFKLVNSKFGFFIFASIMIIIEFGLLFYIDKRNQFFYAIEWYHKNKPKLQDGSKILNNS